MVRAVVLVIAVVACGDNIAAVHLDDYDRAVDEAVCRHRVRCGAARSLEICRMTNVSPSRLDPWTVAAVRAGVLVWDAEAAARCLERFASRSCDTTSESYRYLDCDDVITGTLHDGESCTSSDACISRECWLEQPDVIDGCYRGTCVGNDPPVRGEIGERCRLGGCAPGGQCIASVCEPLLPEDASCSAERACAYGLACVSGSCAPLPSLNESCEDLRACRDLGTRCAPLGPRRCEPIGLPGASCVRTSDCAYPYRCGPTYQCEVATNGAPCGLYPEPCSEVGAICREGQCQPRQPDGAPCDRYDECESKWCEMGMCGGAPACF